MQFVSRPVLVEKQSERHPDSKAVEQEGKEAGEAEMYKYLEVDDHIYIQAGKYGGRQVKSPETS